MEVYRSRRYGKDVSPKTQKSKRVVPIFDELMPYLKSQHELTSSKSEYVFLSMYGTPFNDGNRIRDYHWRKLLEKLMIENNEDILWVSNMLGHTDASMTLQMYAKYKKREDIVRASFLGNI
ncbi:MAG: hypothetical protein PHU40_07090 [Sulfurimonas sp.]|nr:hypothetical protein [Sulfurimonas sp.]